MTVLYAILERQIRKTLCIDGGTINPEKATFDSLGADSMDCLNIAVALNDALKIDMTLNDEIRLFGKNGSNTLTQAEAVLEEIMQRRDSTS